MLTHSDVTIILHERLADAERAHEEAMGAFGHNPSWTNRTAMIEAAERADKVASWLESWERDGVIGA